MCLLLSCLLVGCGEATTEEPEVVEPDLTEHLDAYDVFGIEFQSIGPMCGYMTVGDVIEIHPYYNSTEHIEVEKILLSDRGFWNTILSSVSEQAVIKEYDKYSMFTDASGVSYAYLQLSDDWALIAKSTDLPSYYVKAVMDRLCRDDI